MRRVVALALELSLALLCAACGGGGMRSSAPVTPPVISGTSSLSISPPTAVVVTGEGVGLMASRAVTWRIQEGASAGSISVSSGTTATFTPAIAGVYHILATATDDTSLTAAALAIAAPSRLRSAGSLGAARLAHTATLLPSGKILVAGGGYGPDLIDGFWVVDSAELYDPATGTFTAAGSFGRNQHTATLLRDGTVLLAGGEQGYASVTASSESYDPASNSFTPTGTMSDAREDHTATLLADGRVLITGGFAAYGYWDYGNTPLDTAEIYDPATRRFTRAGRMTSARAFHAATLLADGTVLITGGVTGQSNGAGLLLGGETAEIYDPAVGTFTGVGSMASQRWNHTSTLLPDGRVLLAGGSFNTSAEVYDPAAKTFRVTGPMIATRAYHTATARADGSVLIVGGLDSHGSVVLAELYQPASGTCAPAGVQLAGRLWHSATRLPDGHIVVIGGADSSDGVHLDALKMVEIY